MANVADYKVIQDAKLSGASTHTVNFTFPTGVNLGNNFEKPLLSFTLGYTATNPPSGPTGPLSFSVKVNGVQVSKYDITQSGYQHPFTRMIVINGDRFVAVGTNTIQFTFSGGGAWIEISDVVIHFQRDPDSPILGH